MCTAQYKGFTDGAHKWEIDTMKWFAGRDDDKNKPSGKNIITVCAWCKRVADENGNYYTTNNKLPSNSQITHGICPDCLAKQMNRSR
jgi:hypothetical protein